MKKFQVTVNGRAYEVEVEEVNGNFVPTATTAVAAAPVAAAPAPVVAAPKAAPAPAAAPSGNATPIVAPMPGKIVDVKVAVGQVIKENDLVAILEAMKMETEIFATKSGTVASVNVTTGASVESNDVIVTIN